MLDPSEDMIGKVFFFVGFILAVFVATNSEGFIRGITLGRFGSADVSPGRLRFTQTIAWISALTYAVWFIVGLFTKATSW